MLTSLVAYRKQWDHVPLYGAMCTCLVEVRSLLAVKTAAVQNINLRAINLVQ